MTSNDEASRRTDATIPVSQEQLDCEIFAGQIKVLSPAEANVWQTLSLGQRRLTLFHSLTRLLSRSLRASARTRVWRSRSGTVRSSPSLHSPTPPFRRSSGRTRRRRLKGVSLVSLTPRAEDSSMFHSQHSVVFRLSRSAGSSMTRITSSARLSRRATSQTLRGTSSLSVRRSELLW